MKCPKCGFNSFEYLDACKKCGNTLEVNQRYKIIYGFFEKDKGQEDVNLARSEISKEEVQRPIVSPPPPPDQTHDFTPTPISTPNPLPTELISTFEESLEYKKKEGEIIKPPSSLAGYGSLPREYSTLKENEEILPYNLAGLGLRIGAFLLDIIILFVVTTLTLWVGFSLGSIVFNIREENFVNVIVPLYLILFFLSTTYFVFLQGFSGKTIGKLLFGIRVIRTDGESIGFWDALIRWVGYFISLIFIFIGFIWAIFDPKRQALHDKFAETYVVKE